MFSTRDHELDKGLTSLLKFKILGSQSMKYLISINSGSLDIAFVINM